MSQNGQAHFKNLVANAARFLKCIWFFWYTQKKLKISKMLQSSSTVFWKFTVCNFLGQSEYLYSHYLAASQRSYTWKNISGRVLFLNVLHWHLKIYWKWTEVWVNQHFQITSEWLPLWKRNIDLATVFFGKYSCDNVYHRGKQFFIRLQLTFSQKRKYILVWSKTDQKQPSTGVLRKKHSENMQQIYRRTPMPKCDFNNVAKHYHHVLTWTFSNELTDLLKSLSKLIQTINFYPIQMYTVQK